MLFQFKKDFCSVFVFLHRAAHIFMWDTGTSVGELTGPLKACNNISIKQTRPYRLVVSSEDYSTCYYEGPPFKLKTQFRVSFT